MNGSPPGVVHLDAHAAAADLWATREPDIDESVTPGGSGPEPRACLRDLQAYDKYFKTIRGS